MKRVMEKIKAVAIMLLLFCVVTNSMPAYASELSFDFDTPAYAESDYDVSDEADTWICHGSGRRKCWQSYDI